MAQYLLSVWHTGDLDIDFASPEGARIVGQVTAFNTDLEAAGGWVFGGGLTMPSSATVVRSAARGVSMTDGPYAETKEWMGGFWIIEAADLDEALSWAGKAATACEGAVEVRPFQGE